MKTQTRNVVLKGAMLVLILMLAFGGSASAANGVTANYGHLTLTPVGGQANATNWPEVWDLTKGDLTLSYRIDISDIRQPAPGQTSWTEVGIRQVGYPNFNPGVGDPLQGEVGGWMVSLVGDLTPGPNTPNLHDHHILQAFKGRGEASYDATAPDTVVLPFGTSVSYGLWFDRDGVDPMHAQQWGADKGATYSTRGIYDIVIKYHAIGANLGTMFATVNGIQTGFYSAGWRDREPDKYPAGLSFNGDMAKMQVFAGLFALDNTYGPVKLSQIKVNGITDRKDKVTSGTLRGEPPLPWRD